LAVRYGWRVFFAVLACTGFFWTAIWIVFAADRPSKREVPNETETAEDNGPTALPLTFYLRQPAVIATGISFFGYSYILYFFLTWFPTYLTMARHLNIRDMGFVNTIPWILGVAGLTISGMLCDFLPRMGVDLLRARKLVLVVSLVLAAICVSLSGLVSSLVWAVALMAAAIFFVYLTGTTYWAIIQEIVREEHVGGISGFVHLIANCAGIAGPAVTGFVVQRTAVFKSAFLLAGGIGLIGALLVAMFVEQSDASRVGDANATR
jgi:ACS family hexuronate transporter-like MFS transporter